MKTKWMRMVHQALFVGGAALFLVLLARIGPGAVAEAFSGLSWRVLVILFFPAVLVVAFDTLGWRFAFRRDRLPFRALLLVRLAGEAFNVTTPTASLGGEAVKAWLLRPYAPLEESLSSIVVAKTTHTIAQALFLLLGIAVAWPMLPADSPLLWGMEWLLVLEVMGVAGFVVVQVVGVLGAAGRFLGRLGTVGSRKLAPLDRALSYFYRHEPRRLLLSVACHFLGWALGAVEAYLILHALGLPVSFATALVIEAFGAGISFATFLVPGHLGTLESGYVATFAALGLGAPAGLAFGLISRVREAVWTGVGFLALTALRSPAASSAALESES